MHTITRACSNGELMNCACDPTKRGRARDRKGDFAWGGCSDNVRYGTKFSRMFIDAKEKRVRDARALMNLHNNRAGRRVSHTTKKKIKIIIIILVICTTLRHKAYAHRIKAEILLYKRLQINLGFVGRIKLAKSASIVRRGVLFPHALTSLLPP